jgi:hypothetical protein
MTKVLLSVKPVDATNTLKVGKTIYVNNTPKVSKARGYNQLA